MLYGTSVCDNNKYIIYTNRAIILLPSISNKLKVTIKKCLKKIYPDNKLGMNVYNLMFSRIISVKMKYPFIN